MSRAATESRLNLNAGPFGSHHMTTRAWLAFAVTVLTTRAAVGGADPVPQYSEHFAIIKNGLGGSPDAVFHVIGHPQRSTWGAIGAAADAAFGAKTPTIGTEGGSEIGHLTTSADVTAVKAYFFIAGLRGGGASSSDAGVDGGNGGAGGAVVTDAASGSSGSGGQLASGGQSGTGGQLGTAGIGGAGGASADEGGVGVNAAAASEANGCSCRVARDGRRSSAACVVVLAAWLASASRRRRST
jgi:hypothetical protein